MIRVAGGKLLSLPVLLLLCGSAAAAPEPTPAERLQQVQQQLATSRDAAAVLAKRRSTLDAEILQASTDAADAARRAQQNEAELSALEKALAGLADDQARQSVSLAAQRQAEERVLLSLEQVATAPPGAMLFAPGSPVDVARGGMLLGSALPQLEQAARAYAAALAELHATEADITAKHRAVVDQKTALEQERRRIEAALEKKRQLSADTRSALNLEEKRSDELTAKAASLRDLVAELDRQQAAREEATRREAAIAAQTPTPTHRAAPPAESASEVARLRGEAEGKLANGRLVTPAAGSVVEKFGTAEDYGTSKGVTFETRALAQVVAPAAGRVMFAGPFKGYGRVLIIDHGGGYHSVLAGIDRIRSAVGEKVVAGEPVGTMAADGSPRLYLELRRQGEPVNPLPLLAAPDGKASG